MKFIEPVKASGKKGVTSSSMTLDAVAASYQAAEDKTSAEFRRLLLQE